MDLEHSDTNDVEAEETYSVEVQASEAVHSDVEEDEQGEPSTVVDTPVEETQDETPVEETQDETPVEEIQDETPVEEAYDDDLPTEELPKEPHLSDVRAMLFETFVKSETDPLKGEEKEVETPEPVEEDVPVKKYPIEHYFNKYIHIKDHVNNMMRNMQYDRSRTVHLLLCIVEMVDKITEFDEKKKRELTLYIMNKLINKWNLYLRMDRKVLFDLLAHVYDYLVKVADGQLYTKEEPSCFEYQEPNVITYSLFEKFDKEGNGYNFELMDTVLLLLNEVQKYAFLRVEESKYIVLKVTNMLINNYTMKEEEQSLTLELLPDLIDTLIDIAKDKPREMGQSRSAATPIDETPPPKRKPFWVCCA